MRAAMMAVLLVAVAGPAAADAIRNPTALFAGLASLEVLDVVEGAGAVAPVEGGASGPPLPRASGSSLAAVCR